MDDTIDGSMTVVTALAPTATKAVNGMRVDLRTTVMAGMGPAKRGVVSPCNL